jgi:hypothetical protein
VLEVHGRHGRSRASSSSVFVQFDGPLVLDMNAHHWPACGRMSWEWGSLARLLLRGRWRVHSPPPTWSLSRHVDVG